WESYIIARTSFGTFMEQEMGPQQAHASSLPISREKYNDLQVLSQFCQQPGARAFYGSLTTQDD
ncbi:hypothetical protein L9F63_009792, partial [Diploptera punctata]